MRRVAAGYTTKAIVISPGGENELKPYYDELVKVRVPEIHGLGKLATFKTAEKDSTEDEYLPWAKYIPSNLNGFNSILECKALTIGAGDEVFVTFPTGDASDIVITGVYAKYSEDLYHGIDLSEVVKNATPFTVVKQNLEDPEDPDNPDNPYYPADPSKSNYGANSYKEDYKYIFGYPFTKKQKVTCVFGKPGKWAAGKHTGVDLSNGSSGTPIYAVGDGTVAQVMKLDASYGNCVVISHGSVNGTKLWTLYAHMKNTPLVKIGQKVYGTQLVPDTKWNNAYKKSGTEYIKLTSKPKNWDSGAFTDYYKKTGGTTHNPVCTKIKAVQQKGTQLGVIGNTGNSFGAHLHFEFRKGSNSYYNYTNPNTYVKF